MLTESSVRNAVQYTFYAEPEADRLFDAWLASIHAAERARIAAMVRAEVEGWDRGGSYARQKHTMFNRLADRIAKGDA